MARRDVKRVGQAILAAGLVVVAVYLGRPLLFGEPRVDPYLTFVTAHLDVIRTEPIKSSDARFARDIAKLVDLEHVDPALDACAGPVAVLLEGDWPVLVAEHDYCGGSSWMPRLNTNDVVQLSGPGVEQGLYLTETIKHVPRYDSKLSDLPDGDVVLQTCISRTEMVLIALQYVSKAT
jgi:hypothetical protein